MDSNIIKGEVNFNLNLNESNDINSTTEKTQSVGQRKKHFLFGRRKEMEKDIEELKVRVDVLYDALKNYSDNGNRSDLNNLYGKCSEKMNIL